MLDNELNNYTLYLRSSSTDMRKRGNSLAFLVQSEMELNPFQKNLFLFCGRTRKILKVLVWDTNGFWELTKKLESGTYCWPGNTQEAMQVSREEVVLMLRGENPWRRLPELKPKRVC